jgi:hypothetical protein
LARNVNYEIPALKKQIAKCQQIQKVYYVLTFPTHNFPKNSICTLSLIHDYKQNNSYIKRMLKNDPNDVT